MRYLHHLNHMRGIAIVPIVAVHCLSMFDWREDSFGDIVQPLFVNVNILFTFISGYLFQHLSAGFRYGVYLKKRITNVGVPYVLVSAPAIVIYIGQLKHHSYLSDGFLDGAPAYVATRFLLTGAHLGPLWFIPMMFVFYLLAPLFLRIVERRELIVALPLLFVFSELIGRPDHNLGTLHVAVFFAPVYLLGMLFARHAAMVDTALRRAVGPVVLCGLLAAVLSMALNAHDIWAPQLVLKAVICISVYAILVSLPARRIASLDLLASYAFGIFFVHGYLVGLGRVLVGYQAGSFEGSFLAVLTATAVVLATSLAIAAASRAMLRQRSRYVLGC
jgi:probable poly-beta-1,6-N-acetyl-D-glucosamine export protein